MKLAQVHAARAVRRSRRLRRLAPKIVAWAVAPCFAADHAVANPTGYSAVNGHVTFNYNGQLR